MTGKPLHVQLTQGQRHESIVGRDLLEYARGKYFLGDAGYDSNALIDATREVDMIPVICPNKTRKVHKLKLDRKRYGKRYLVECFFHHIKRFRAIATRYEKSARNYLALVHLACAMRGSRRIRDAP